MAAIEEIKRLEGWFTFEEAGEVLGYSKQGIHRLVFESPNSPFEPDKDVRGVGGRPLMLLREDAVNRVKTRLKPASETGWGKSRIGRPDQEK